MKKKDFFGINIMKYVSEHETYLQENLQKKGCSVRELLVCHETKIRWLQHERMVHLLVTIFTALLFLFLIALSLMMGGGFLLYILLCIVAILLILYIYHYFLLENKVQHWYKLYDEIYGRNIRGQ